MGGAEAGAPGTNRSRSLPSPETWSPHRTTAFHQALNAGQHPTTCCSTLQIHFLHVFDTCPSLSHTPPPLKHPRRVNQVFVLPSQPPLPSKRLQVYCWHCSKRMSFACSLVRGNVTQEKYMHVAFWTRRDQVRW